jgi:putative ABC transport system ATP-binding protein
MFELFQVSKRFNAGKANQFLALDDVSLTVPQGQLTILKGPSGSGKTTLLTLIGCMARPTSGRIRLHGIDARFLAEGPPENGLDISSLPERFLTQIRRSTFGFIFQQFNLIRGISVLENIMLPAYVTGEGHAAIRGRAVELLDVFGISRHAASPVELLSGGELQRAAIARSLINDPRVIIADEPTAHLDSRLSREFMEIVVNLKKAGKTVVIASHDPIVYDAAGADLIIEMRDGRIIGSGPRA